MKISWILVDLKAETKQLINQDLSIRDSAAEERTVPKTV